MDFLPFADLTTNVFQGSLQFWRRKGSELYSSLFALVNHHFSFSLSPFSLASLVHCLTCAWPLWCRLAVTWPTTCALRVAWRRPTCGRSSTAAASAWRPSSSFWSAAPTTPPSPSLRSSLPSASAALPSPVRLPSSVVVVAVIVVVVVVVYLLSACYLPAHQPSAGQPPPPAPPTVELPPSIVHATKCVCIWPFDPTSSQSAAVWPVVMAKWRMLLLLCCFRLCWFCTNRQAGQDPSTPSPFMSISCPNYIIFIPPHT